MMDRLMMRLFRKHMKWVIAGVVLLLVIANGSAFYYFRNSETEASLSVSKASSRYNDAADDLANSPYVPSATASSITGLPCADFDKRPLAMMYSGDPETRQYYGGIAEAGFVVEMAHRAQSGETRVMGVFDCEKPQFVGPMRSGRVDFLNVAASFDAVYVPWGGDSVTRNLLQQGVQNHIDCSNETVPRGSAEACFARPETDVPLPDENRIFGDASLLFQQAADLGYDLTGTFGGFQHASDLPRRERPKDGILDVEYTDGFDVTYVYDRQLNRYERFFNEEIEYDLNTSKQVTPRNIIVFKTPKTSFTTEEDYGAQGLRDPWEGVSRDGQINESGLYPNFALGDAWFDTVREGWAHFYINGQEIIGSWRRESRDPRAPFVFLDGEGQRINFVPGQIWMHVLDETRSFSWTEL